MAPVVGIIMGSQSDWATLRHAAETLERLAVPHETRIVSAHRTPDRLREYAVGARQRGLKVIIAGAGGAAHLPGMCAAWTPLPVLGVPVESHSLKGMDSLLSIVQMPAGVPVGTLAIGRAGAVNAALLAAAILATGDRGLAARLDALREEQTGRRGGRAGRLAGMTPPAAAERHHRSGRRRPAWPDVGARRRPPRLSLPYPDPREGQPGQPGLGGDDHQRLPRAGRPSANSPPRSM